ncbi:MAG: ABC transporter permease [Oscillospiraceae bacterium]|nr:ABC transporter permease [Oscillospiraceae bacterium]
MQDENIKTKTPDAHRKTRKEPFVRIVKRSDIQRAKAWMIRVGAIILAMCVGGIIVLLMGHNPFAVYSAMFTGSFATATSRSETIKTAVPLLGAAIAIAPSFRMRFWNIGAEGQILVGAVAATYFALYVKTMPSVMLLLAMMLAAMVAGGIWGLIPGFFKAKWGTNETLFTLMLNYIALELTKYFQHGPWRNPMSGGFPKIAMFDNAARLPKLGIAGIFDVHIGWIFVLVLAVLMLIYLRHTKQGYEIAVVGESERTARYASMNVGKIIMRTVFISGAIAGLVGFLLVSGANGTLSDSTAGGVGFTAISVAWLAKLNPIVMIFIALFIAVLSKGSNTIQTNFKIPASAADVLTGIILFFMLGCEFFINYKLIFRGVPSAESTPPDSTAPSPEVTAPDSAAPSPEVTAPDGAVGEEAE